MEKVTNAQLVNCLNLGMSINDIRIKFNYVNNNNVIKRLKKLGLIELAYKNSNVFENGRTVDYDQVIKLINNKLTVHEISKKLNCSIHVIKYIAKKFNLKIAPKDRILDINFTDEEFQVLYGTLLGDAHLSKYSKNV